MMKDDKKNQKQKGEEETQKIESEEVIELKKHNEELENSYKRALADYQNLEKRTLEQRKDWIITANKELILRILPTLDHLEKALQGAREKGEQSGWVQGVEMAVKELRKILEEEGLRPVQTEDFDPNLHEAVEVIEGKNGKILNVLQMGYTLNEKLIRPARVIVGKSK